ncbi:nitrite reductase small subunit, partial [Klebsiella pneumoniae]|nr:nitrite reductase small subunit [Klebsiella pneumoniae]
MSQWVNICSIDDILPATGVCALLGQQKLIKLDPKFTD